MSGRHEESVDEQINRTMSDCLPLLGEMKERVGVLPVGHVGNLFLKLREVEDEVSRVTKQARVRQELRRAYGEERA